MTGMVAITILAFVPVVFALGYWAGIERIKADNLGWRLEISGQLVQCALDKARLLDTIKELRELR